MVKDYLNELNIHFIYISMWFLVGVDVVFEQLLGRRETTCGFTPVDCTNQAVVQL